VVGGRGYCSGSLTAILSILMGCLTLYAEVREVVLVVVVNGAPQG
jgi:hypothetical protein